MIRSQEPFPTSSVFLFLIVLLWPAFLHLSFFLFPRGNHLPVHLSSPSHRAVVEFFVFFFKEGGLQQDSLL